VRGPQPEKTCPPHEVDKNGEQCCVGHYKDGILQPSCLRCVKCHRWIGHGEENEPVIIDYCDRCKIKPQKVWYNPQYYPDHGGSWCHECLDKAGRPNQ
jgi:hypothetical protein